jgi:hypothetical protein
MRPSRGEWSWRHLWRRSRRRSHEALGGRSCHPDLTIGSSSSSTSSLCSFGSCCRNLIRSTAPAAISRSAMTGARHRRATLAMFLRGSTRGRALRHATRARSGSARRPSQSMAVIDAMAAQLVWRSPSSATGRSGEDERVVRLQLVEAEKRALDLIEARGLVPPPACPPRSRAEAGTRPRPGR